VDHSSALNSAFLVMAVLRDQVGMLDDPIVHVRRER
jgi:hypothetical protein